MNAAPQRRRPCCARRHAAGISLALAVVGIGGCAPADGPDLVLVTVEALRTDRLGAYGDASTATPALDALALEGVVFEHAVTPSPSTLASVATILSGLGPHRHGVVDDLRFRLRPQIATVAERLGDAGYDSAAFPGSLALHGIFGVGQGFGVYDDAIPHPLDPESAAAARRSADRVTDLALTWLAERSQRPVFLWVHYADLRAPRQSPEGDGDAYTRALAALDAHIGRLLDGVSATRGARDRLIVVTATQAEALGEHDEWGHGWLASESTLRVPLLVAGTGFARGKRAQHWVSHTDIAPSLLRAAGLETEAGTGNLRRERDPSPGAEEFLGFEARAAESRLGWSAIRGVRSGRWKYTAHPEPAVLHDVQGDPGETRDRRADEPERAAKLAAAYASLAAIDSLDAAESATDRDERIATIGHLPGVPREIAGGRRRGDPRRFVRAISWVDHAVDLAGAGRVSDGLGALEVLANNPLARPLALRKLGALLLLSDRPRDAVSRFRELAKLTGSAHAEISLAASLVAAERGEEALRVLDRVADRRPVLSSRALLMRGHALLSTRRPGEALVVAEQVLARRPDDDSAVALASRARAEVEGDAAERTRLEGMLAGAPDPGTRVETRLALAALLVRGGRDREADEVLAADPDPGMEILAARAGIASRHSNPDRATRLYERALAQRPSARHFHRELASLYEKEGRFVEAARLYAELLDTGARDPALLVARGAALARADHLDDAERDYRAALALDPELSEAHFNLALIAIARQDDGSAETLLQRAIALDPGFAVAHLELSRLYHRRGDPRSGEHAARAVETVVPTQGLH